MIGPPNRNTKTKRGDDRTAGAERDVAEDVEERDLVGKFGQPVEHRVEP